MTSLRSQIIHRALHQIIGAMSLNYSIQEQRFRLDQLARQNLHLPRGITIRVTEAGGVPAEWIEPDGLDSQRIILYLHGGGYCICSLDTHRALAARLALASQTRLLIIDYRLAPEHPFPAALEDSLAADRWLLDKGISSDQVIIGGDSAGGGLALSTVISLRDSGEALPSKIFLISPWTDLTFSGDSFLSRNKTDPIFGEKGNRLGFAPAYLGSQAPTNPLISPLFADLHDLPPVLIHVGSDEILLDDSQRLAGRLDGAGVTRRLKVWEGMWHVFQVFAPFIPEAQQSINQIGGFILDEIS